jgi:predicted nucleic acid-binding Zn ribbon protein
MGRCISNPSLKTERHAISVALGELVYCGKAVPHRQLCFDPVQQSWALQPRRMRRLSAVRYFGLISLILVGVLWLSQTEVMPLQLLSELWGFRDSPAKLDRVLEIKDADHLAVSYRQVPMVWVQVGQQLPSGATLLKINMHTKTAQTDFGLLTME